MQTSEANYTHKMTTQDLNGLRLYLITDRSLFDGGGKFLDAVETALMGGVKAIQLREKDLSDYELVELGEKLRLLTSN
ncbi:MAG: thiamine phosphate synthase, partial [Gammaproteobacteria bacterium]|nr:thiamine phosphate synthase [Gammaproteobacteria bacterium]